MPNKNVNVPVTLMWISTLNTEVSIYVHIGPKYFQLLGKLQMVNKNKTKYVLNNSLSWNCHNGFLNNETEINDILVYVYNYKLYLK